MLSFQNGLIEKYLDGKLKRISLEELVEKIVESLNNSNVRKIFEYLDEYHLRYNHINFRYKGNTILSLLLISKLSNELKCKILRRLTFNYKININRRVFNDGNIIVNSVGYIDDLEWYALLIINGVDVNSVDYKTDDKPKTTLDLVIQYYPENSGLIELLKRNGAISYSDIKKIEMNKYVKVEEVNCSNQDDYVLI
jgi:hypothetical protein